MNRGGIKVPMVLALRCFTHRDDKYPILPTVVHTYFYIQSGVSFNSFTVKGSLQ